MKNTGLILLLLVSFINFSAAQNSMISADDEDRIAVGIKQPSALSEDIPQGSYALLANRLSKAASLNGLAADGEGQVFNMVPSVAVVEKSVSGSVPPMIAQSIEVSVKLVESLNGNTYEQADFSVKGVGDTEEKAMTDAFRKIDARNPQLKAFFRKGKQRILEYYNGNCDLILAEADGMVHAKRYLNAYHLLMSTPKASRECFDRCMEKIAEFGDKIPPEYQPAEEVVADEEPDKPVSANRDKRVVLTNGLEIHFAKAENLGKQTILEFQIMNSTGEEQLIKTGPRLMKLINGEGEEFKPQSVSIGNKKEKYININYTILPETPTVMRCVFPVVSYARQWVVTANDNTYKIDRLPLIK
ncbi:MAG: hypothetical protein ACQESX_01275 [Bacteroidota bacterium]